MPEERTSATVSTRRREGEEPARSSRSSQSVKLPTQLRKRPRLWAALSDREISQIVEESVSTHLDRLERERAERGLPSLPPPEA
jgi:hypothetical protein